MILITDAEMKSSLPFIRSLGEKGFKIHVTSPTRFSSGAFSKYTTFVKDPKYDEYDFIIPISDRSTEFFVDKNYNTLLPDKENYLIARDKKRTMELAEKTGVPYPKTADIDKVDSLKFPIITKPRDQFGARGVCLSKNMEEFEENTKGKENLIAQEFIPPGGKNYCVDMIFKDNTLISLYMTEIHRTYPVYAGPDIITETIYDENLKKSALKLMSKLKWNGIINIEFKKNPITQEYMLLEINPRASSSIGISVKAGLDFPYILYKAFKGEIQEKNTYNIGEKYLDTYNYILSIFQEPSLKGTQNPFVDSCIDKKDVLPHLIELTYPFNTSFKNKDYLKRTNKLSRKNMKLLRN